MDQKNQLILKKNEQIKNSIFSIDGIIEANTKEGNPIPLFVEVNNGNIMLEKSKNNNMQKNGSDSIKLTRVQGKKKIVLNLLIVMKSGVIINIFIVLRFIFELDLFYFFQDEL